MTPRRAGYYADLKDGLEYEGFVIDWVNAVTDGELKPNRVRYAVDALDHNRRGYEIKFDRLHKETGNLFIETAEKTFTEEDYKPSGICNPAADFLLIGNYEVVYCYSCDVLQNVAHDRPIIKNPTATGFVLDRTELRMLAEWILE